MHTPSTGVKNRIEQFASVLCVNGRVDAPVRAELANAAAHDPHRIPSGIVVSVDTHAPLVSELLKRDPVQARALLELDVSAVDSASVGAVAARLKTVLADLLAESAANSVATTYSLDTRDSVHWEANMSHARVGLMQHNVNARASYQSLQNKFSHHKITARTTPVASATAATTQSFLTASLQGKQQEVRYALEVVSAMPTALQQRYDHVMEHECATAGQVAAHPVTQAVQSFLTRNTNRIMYEVAERMGWSVPCEVDVQSCFHNKADFSAPLMAKPDICHLVNSMHVEAAEAVLYNGAVNLQQNGGLVYAMVDLGPEVGTAVLSVGAAHTGAVPAYVARAPLDLFAPIDGHPAIANISAYMGDTKRALFQQKHFQSVNDAFLIACQKCCGHAGGDALDMTAAHAPMIFSPVCVAVGREFDY